MQNKQVLERESLQNEKKNRSLVIAVTNDPEDHINVRTSDTTHQANNTI